jgi:hypothetical protein
MTTIIPFPSSKRRGHAVKVALLLKSARTQREAEHLLNRSGKTFQKQLREANIDAATIDMETNDCLALIRQECCACGSHWGPEGIITQGKRA